MKLLSRIFLLLLFYTSAQGMSGAQVQRIRPSFVQAVAAGNFDQAQQFIDQLNQARQEALAVVWGKELAEAKARMGQISTAQEAAKRAAAEAARNAAQFAGSQEAAKRAAAEAARSAEEIKRLAAEQQRKVADSARAAEEARRVAAEQQRQAEQEARKRAEQAGKEAQARAAQEQQLRAAAEQARAQGADYSQYLLKVLQERDQQLKAQYDNFTRAFTGEQQRNNQLQQQLAKQQNDLQEASKYIATCGQTVKILQDAAQTQQQVCAEQIKRAMSEGQLKELKAESATIEQLRNEKKKLENDLAVERQRAQKASSQELERAHETERALRKQIDELNKNMPSFKEAQARRELVEKRAQEAVELNNKLNTQNRELEQRLSVAAQEIKDLDNTLKAFRSGQNIRVEEMRKEYDERLRKSGAIIQDMVALKGQLKEAQDLAEVDRATAKQQLAKLRAELESTQKEAKAALNNLNEENRKSLARIKELESNKKTSASDCAAAQEKVRQVQADLANAQERIKRTESSLDKARKSEEAFLEDADALKKENDELKKQVAKESPANAAAVKSADERARQLQEKLELELQNTKKAEARNINYRTGLERINNGLGAANAAEIKRWIGNLLANPSNNPVQ